MVAAAVAGIRLQDIAVVFPGVRALDGVDFSVARGEVHALCGENGAGKSTLMKVLSGIHPAGRYEGRILARDAQGEETEWRFADVAAARRHGIAIVHQELALLPELSVVDNLFLGQERRHGPLLDRRGQREQATRHLAGLDLDLPLDRPVARLGIGQQQRLEIARALLDQPAFLVLDEPTSALPDDDARALLAWIRDLADGGTGCIYISHRMPEVFAIADRITVLRDGRTVWTRPVADTGPDQVVAAMVDRPAGAQVVDRAPGRLGATLVTVEGLRVVRGRRRILELDQLALRAGEIVGLAGMMGSGRTCLLRSLVGALDDVQRQGRCRWGTAADTEPLPADPAAARERGLLLIPEDRKSQALFLDRDLVANVTAATEARYHRAVGFDEAARLAAARRRLTDLAVRAAAPTVAVRTLSGGNQQKVLLARAAEVEPRILLLDEPTRGIDVGAKAEIYRLMAAWAAAGWAICWASSELTELLAVSHRLLVLADGRCTATFDQPPFTEAAVMAAAAGAER